MSSVNLLLVLLIRSRPERPLVMHLGVAGHKATRQLREQHWSSGITKIGINIHILTSDSAILALPPSQDWIISHESPGYTLVVPLAVPSPLTTSKPFQSGSASLISTL